LLGTTARIKACPAEMPIYSFEISHGQSSNAVTSAHLNNQAAQREALAMVADLARDIVGTLETSPEWQVTVADDAGKPIFVIKISADLLE
jgi:hypothetical protein